MKSFRCSVLRFFSVLPLLVIWTAVTAQLQDLEHVRLCNLETTCKGCMEASPICAWCSHWEYANSTVGKLRCSTKDRLEKFNCPKESIQVAPLGSSEFLENKEFQDVTAAQTSVQLRPQRIRVTLRPHSTETIRVQYRPAKNYPLDLYYLMDLTWSMKDDKDTLVSLGSKMANTLGSFTENFRLGFGSYSDKPLMPYLFPGTEENPCKSEFAKCSPAYSFRHSMNLSSDVEQFVRKVNSSAVTGNADNLEGGLDGIIQATVCAELVGWNRQARKLMLLATDGSLHFAGDGKLGGVVARQDFQCHLDEFGEYSMAKVYDYPSLAEVSRILQANKVNLIFAVSEERRNEYELMADLLKEKARVATLAANSSNILEIVEKAYREIVSKVVLRDNSTGIFSVEYSSNCGVPGGPMIATSECNGLQEGRIYEFNVKFTLRECPQNESLWRQTVVIDDALASQASETKIEIELLCGCDCVTEDHSKCKEGINECGICKCNYGWSGETCDCDENLWAGNGAQCINPGEDEICSGRGECICGGCSCDSGFSGPFCECSACEKEGGVECGGRGTCDCGVCECTKEWVGDRCQCPSSDDSCIIPGTSEICAGHGYCDCGQCRCNETAPGDQLLYRGQYCEVSAGSGANEYCGTYNDCVNATVEDPKAAGQLCRTNVTRYKTERIKEIDKGHDHYCFLRYTTDSSICTIPFIYLFNKDNTITLNIGDKSCSTPMPAAFVPGLVFTAVVIVGIISLLIWKFWTKIKDDREYAKFKLEQKSTIYALDQNPIYRPATTRFRVPSMIRED